MKKYDYNKEFLNLMNNIYKFKVYDTITKFDLNVSDIESLKLKKVYFGSDMYDYVVSQIPKGKDGYYFRAMVCEYKNYSYPKLFDYLGNPLKTSNYTHCGIRIWEERVNEMILDDVSNRFNLKDFYKFIDDNLDLIKDTLLENISKYKKQSSITIPVSKNSDLISTIKSMLLKNQLDKSLLYKLIDIDALRDEMVKLSVAFSFYDEFDRLEDDLEYCLNNHFKYNTFKEVSNILVNEYNFIYIENVGFVKN